MKNYILSFIIIFGASLLVAQEPFVTNRFVNRNLHQQDGHFLITTIDAPVYHYALSGESFVTSEVIPLLLIQEDTTSTAFPESISGLTVFPNPVRDLLFIQRETTDEALNIELFTTDGRQVFRRTWPPGVISFQPSLSPLVQGTYVLIVTDQSRTKGNQYKIIRQ